MIIGHGPSGYIATHYLSKHFAASGVGRVVLLVLGIVGALAPDLDMFYFHLVDGRQHHHHTYFSHWPVFWFAVLLVALAWQWLQPRSRYAALCVIFCIGGVLHILLDSIVGDIWWLAPWVDRPYALFTVPALYQPWWLNFLLHWSFALELALWIWALLIYRRRASAGVEGLSR
ncbi:MAG: metal-dependent hydrolase [Chitinimonas sp.]|nr:metal-dependent hydrolase [Chitinimonas sp.]